MITTLQTPISLFRGHGPTHGTPQWSGTIGEFWEANDGLDYAALRTLQRDLESQRKHLIGGGGAAEFTVTLKVGA